MAPEDAKAIITDDRLLSGMQTLSIEGLAGDLVQVHRVFPVTESLGQIVLDGNGTGTLSLAAPLALGEVLVLEPSVVGRKTGQLYSVMEVDGFGESIPTWGPINQLSDSLQTSAYVNAPYFSIPLEVGVTIGGPSSFPTYTTSSLVVGTRADIVDLGGGKKALLGPGVQAFASELGFLESGEDGIDAVDLPIPNDSDLAYAEIALQWWVVGPDSQVYISEIALVTVLPDIIVPPDIHPSFFDGMGQGGIVLLSSGGGAGSRSLAKRADPRAQLKAVSAWLKKCGGARIDNSMRLAIMKKRRP